MWRSSNVGESNIGEFIRNIGNAPNDVHPMRDLGLATWRTRFHMMKLEESVATLDEAIHLIGEMRDRYRSSQEHVSGR
ncbi:MAG: hypothetical protein ACR2O4_18495 [Hyphomicrobiaceae bacterium]